MKAIMNDEVMERLIDTLMELQKKESTDLPLLKKQLAETEKGINNMLNASEPHMADIIAYKFLSLYRLSSIFPIVAMPQRQPCPELPREIVGSPPSTLLFLTA